MPGFIDTPIVKGPQEVSPWFQQIKQQKNSLELSEVERNVCLPSLLFVTYFSCSCSARTDF